MAVFPTYPECVHHAACLVLIIQPPQGHSTNSLHRALFIGGGGSFGSKTPPKKILTQKRAKGGIKFE